MCGCSDEQTLSGMLRSHLGRECLLWAPYLVSKSLQLPSRNGFAAIPGQQQSRQISHVRCVGSGGVQGGKAMPYHFYGVYIHHVVHACVGDKGPRYACQVHVRS
jgi:hypothetical protein